MTRFYAHLHYLSLEDISLIESRTVATLTSDKRESLDLTGAAEHGELICALKDSYSKLTESPRD